MNIGNGCIIISYMCQLVLLAHNLKVMMPVMMQKVMFLHHYLLLNSYSQSHCRMNAYLRDNGLHFLNFVIDMSSQTYHFLEVYYL